MLNTILIILAGLAVLGLAAFYITTHASHVVALGEKVNAEVRLLEEQANHIRQTADAEAANLAENIKAFEKQGVNKFRTEIARASLSLKELEERLGSKIKAISHEEHEEKLAVSRKIIADLHDQLDKLQPIGGSGALVFATRPTLVTPGEGTALGSPV